MPRLRIRSGQGIDAIRQCCGEVLGTVVTDVDSDKPLVLVQNEQSGDDFQSHVDCRFTFRASISFDVVYFCRDVKVPPNEEVTGFLCSIAAVTGVQSHYRDPWIVFIFPL